MAKIFFFSSFSILPKPAQSHGILGPLPSASQKSWWLWEGLMGIEFLHRKGLLWGLLGHIHALGTPLTGAEFQVFERWIRTVFSSPNSDCLYIPSPSFSPPTFLWGEDPLSLALTCSFLSGQNFLCGLVVLRAKQSRRRNSILGSVSYSYCSSISGLGLPKRKKCVFWWKGRSGWIKCECNSFWKKKQKQKQINEKTTTTTKTSAQGGRKPWF